MSISDFATEMNRLGRDKVPFLFLVDFEMEKPLLFNLAEVAGDKIMFDVNGIKNHDGGPGAGGPTIVEKKPEPWISYKRKFDDVFRRLEYGDSFLTNLTIRTEIVLDRSIRDIFFQSRAKYKLLFGDDFLVFSPETFIQIKGGKIFSFPMKGTIDAAIHGAEEKILNDLKETSEHVTIVDLIRNDISQIATEVQVTRFRYIDKIRTSSKTLLQVSSEIVGQLESGYLGELGNILVRLLPGGSVSGAPKSRTLEIIRQTEMEKRGFYTGVFGIFDGESLDSGVMIRFIERQGSKYFYRSGGGITTQSNPESEYQEAIDKVYVPIN
ncbi:MAG TPA: aminodeoxychorismate synthase component I [Chryseolinea sp.]|nr:aminodeoxychorismate synthase component I [Chryseolinea sp.]